MFTQKQNHGAYAADIGVYKAPMHCISKHSVISRLMGKAADLSVFDKGQIVMAQALETLISETARLVGCIHVVLVSTYRKWCMDGETSLRRIHSRGEQRLLRMICRERRVATAEITNSYSSASQTVIRKTEGRIHCCV